MTQLTYNEAFDPYHAVFRFIRLHQACDISERLPFDTLRILDFYLLFPFRLQSMRLFSDDKEWRKLSRSYEDQAPYLTMPHDGSIFPKMEPFQQVGATSLVRNGYLSAEAWGENEIQFTSRAFSPAVVKRCAELNTQMAAFTDVLCQLKLRYPLNGRNGLKDRTGLLEYRYDSI